MKFEVNIVYLLFNKLEKKIKITILSDKRSENYFLTNKPPILWATILVGYVILVKQGPKWMKNREPFELKKTILAYNLFQVVANTFVCLKVSSNLS